MIGALLGGAAGAEASPSGDLDGDGSVGVPDVGVLAGLFGAEGGDPDYAPPADLDGDGAIALPDLRILLTRIGTTGAADTTPPGLFVSLNDIPDLLHPLRR